MGRIRELTNERTKAPVPMVSPAMDDEEGEFCYYRRPTDVIGWKDSRECVQVTADGYIFSHNNGQLMFFAGNPPEPLTKRVKTLHSGYLPIIEYKVAHGDAEYSFQMFSRPLGGKPENPLVTHVRVEVRNTSFEQRYCHLATAVRFRGPGDNPWGIADNTMSNHIGSIPREHFFNLYDDVFFEKFNPEWRYFFRENKVFRDDHVIYAYDADVLLEQADTLFPLIQGYRTWNNRFAMQETTPAGVVLFGKVLEPDESFTVTLKVPAAPLREGSAELQQMLKLDYGKELKETIRFWQSEVDSCCPIRVPERKVEDGIKANFIFNCIAREKNGHGVSQRVNKFQYNAFWLRDASFIARSYEVLGRADMADEVISSFFEWQRDDGNFLSQGGQYDGWGQALWAIGQHFLMTNNRKFAEAAFPRIELAIDWLRQVRKRDVYNLVPETTPGDNEAITGHVTGHSIWALTGIRYAATLAEQLGRNDRAGEWRELYDDYLEAFSARLDVVLERTDGYIPPGLDEVGGEDWGNLKIAFLGEVLPPDHPAVEKTMEVARSKFREGLMTYYQALYLHHYLTFRISHTAMMQDRQLTVLEDLYNVLVHTGSTHTGFETKMVPWANRDFGFNMAPHGWYGAEYIIFIRNMLVREEGDALHLFSVISPAWIKEGSTLGVEDAPTLFGKVTALLTCDTDSTATIRFAPRFTRAPGRILLHLPVYMHINSISINGETAEIPADGPITVPSGECVIEISWSKDGGLPEISFRAAVQNFKKEWARRYGHWLRTGETLPDEDYCLFPRMATPAFVSSGNGHR